MPKMSFQHAFENCTTLNHISFPTITGVGTSCSDEEYLRNTEENAWKNLFEVYCTRNPDQADTYNTLLKLSNNDYKSTVLNIETMNDNEK